MVPAGVQELPVQLEEGLLALGERGIVDLVLAVQATDGHGQLGNGIAVYGQFQLHRFRLDLLLYQSHSRLDLLDGRAPDHRAQHKGVQQVLQDIEVRLSFHPYLVGVDDGRGHLDRQWLIDRVHHREEVERGLLG